MGLTLKHTLGIRSIHRPVKSHKKNVSRPYTLNNKNNNSIFTINNRPVRPNHITTPGGDPFNEAVFESTIPIFHSVEDTVAFRDHVLRRIDFKKCKWTVSRNMNDNEAVFSTRTSLVNTHNGIVNQSNPSPFNFQGDDVMEKLIVHSVAILIVDEIRFIPTNNTLDIDGRLWVPPTNVQLDMGNIVKMYNTIMYD